MKRSDELSPQKQAQFMNYCIENGLMKPSWFLKLCIWVACIRNKNPKIFWDNLAIVSPKTVEDFYKQVEEHYPKFDEKEKAKIEAFFVSSPWNL